MPLSDSPISGAPISGEVQNIPEPVLTPTLTYMWSDGERADIQTEDRSINAGADCRYIDAQIDLRGVN